MTRLHSLAPIQQPTVYATFDLFIRRVALALRCVVALESGDMTVTAEIGRLIHASALDGDGKFPHFIEIYGVALLHIKLDGVEEFAQYQPYVRGLCRAVLLNHCLNLFQGYDTLFHGVGIVLIIVLATLDLVLKKSVMYGHNLCFLTAKVVLSLETAKLFAANSLKLVYKFTEFGE